MPIRITDKIAALVEALRLEGFDGMPPAERRRLADLCRYIADKAEPKVDAPKAGVLAELRAGEPRHE